MQEAYAIRERLFHLRPVFRQRQPLAGGLLDTTPWVDVILLIVLVFIVQTATLKKPGLQVDLPVAPPSAGARYDAHVLTVPREGVFYFGDERVTWVVLADRLRGAAAAVPNPELIIEADSAVSHGAMTMLYTLAVDAGWTKVVVATRLERALP